MSHYVATYLLVNRQGALIQNDSPIQTTAKITGAIYARANPSQIACHPQSHGKRVMLWIAHLASR
jgi:hypothetical protein